MDYYSSRSLFRKKKNSKIMKASSSRLTSVGDS
jgi:hypothetical protein